MSEKFDFLVFIGRFQPFHRGHLSVVQQGLEQSRQLIVLIGSAHQPRNPRNPWSYDEREQMIRASLTEEQNQRLLVAPLMDIPYNDEAWVRNVQTTVAGYVTAHYALQHKQPKIGLIGLNKDHTSYYLKRFPRWDSVAVESFAGLAATSVRGEYFGERAGDYLLRRADDELPAAVREELARFTLTEAYGQIQSELDFIQRYKQAWEAAPYAPTFVTVDAVVVQSGHVLLVERKANPGQGLLALPGGFVDQHERLADACLRELREETRLKVPEPVLRGSMVRQEVFDEPMRSARGRTITHAFYIELAPSESLPKVKGGDDAKHAMWVPLGELDPRRMFEDHYFIIQELLGIA